MPISPNPDIEVAHLRFPSVVMPIPTSPNPGVRSRPPSIVASTPSNMLCIPFKAPISYPPIAIHRELLRTAYGMVSHGTSASAASSAWMLILKADLDLDQCSLFIKRKQKKLLWEYTGEYRMFFNGKLGGKWYEQLSAKGSASRKGNETVAHPFFHILGPKRIADWLRVPVGKVNARNVQDALMSAEEEINIFTLECIGYNEFFAHDMLTQLADDKDEVSGGARSKNRSDNKSLEISASLELKNAAVDSGSGQTGEGNKAKETQATNMEVEENGAVDDGTEACSQMQGNKAIAMELAVEAVEKESGEGSKLRGSSDIAMEEAVVGDGNSQTEGSSGLESEDTAVVQVVVAANMPQGRDEIGVELVVDDVDGGTSLNLEAQGSPFDALEGNQYKSRFPGILGFTSALLNDGDNDDAPERLFWVSDSENYLGSDSDDRTGITRAKN
ncbi:hypothetical protein BT96DRAFT_1017910 [Gymnopus androsaceus JB14]|uniref:DUF6697 domain-containing protein n=1 Tax=Gymnopus androsaceus JB14 TaxID=1447944 RepID=A0A6A4HW31_9AGAR|nr:hypothetical protein BT96DRAFT_1017910 [Gymnopus androsaceus JB14]